MFHAGDSQGLSKIFFYFLLASPPQRGVVEALYLGIQLSTRNSAVSTAIPNVPVFRSDLCILNNPTREMTINKRRSTLVEPLGPRLHSQMRCTALHKKALR